MYPQHVQHSQYGCFYNWGQFLHNPHFTIQPLIHFVDLAFNKQQYRDNMDMLTRLMIVSIVCCFFIQQSQGSQIVSNMLGRKLQQEETLNSEQIRLTSEECNPTQQDCTKSEDCDEIPPSGLFTCQWYAENGACSGIDTTFCRTSCNRCGCEDVEFPGLQCSYILSAQLCATPEIVQGKYCQRACGVCDTINQNQISTVNVNAYAVASNNVIQNNTANAISSDADVAEKSQATVLIEFTSNLPRDSTSLFNWVGEDPCENWVGITCENSEITEIRLRQNLLLQEKLQTSIPSALSTFKNLKFVDFSEMKLTGMLPPELSTLVQLENIDISQNSLTGKIPVEYSTWTSLKFVYFNDNSFADVLHKQFSTWDQIMALDL
eukprot:TRINITY_DN4933_c0_g1_i5.p1 TRINITY_DN4933_c0_g1~~TRINITY_DN4933_c0_g1_i5.p1  ORF type:complete len:377 (-),score=26.17 TRINITY_DN4933_c0_g1_i5:71-1201(-)